MAKPKKKKKTKKKQVTRKRTRTAAKKRTQTAQSSNSALPNLNQIAPKLDFKISGTAILPGLKPD